MQASPYGGDGISGFEPLIQQLGWPSLSSWQSHWQQRQGLDLARDLWPEGTDARWITGLALPFLSLLERAASGDTPQLIGLSALPGTGKSTLCAWIEAVAAASQQAIAVVSLDDFYWPAEQLEASIRGNPWHAPRALPGSHDLALLQRSLDDWQRSGTLHSPRFERALRDGRGDRAGWRDRPARVVVLEGWFVGVDPWMPSQDHDDLATPEDPTLVPTLEELAYRPTVRAALQHYTPLWDRLNGLWHLRAPSTASSLRWKEQQEALLRRRTGVSMPREALLAFVRSMQLAILPKALHAIPRANTLVQLDADRRIQRIELRAPEPQAQAAPRL